MRYLKVFFLVLLFFFVMLFFVQNQPAFSTTMPLKLDLMMDGWIFESRPVPFYTLLLVCFLLGALITLLMLVWDRVSLSTRLTFTSMKARGLEKDAGRFRRSAEQTETKLAEMNTKMTELDKANKELKAQLQDAENRVKQAERAVAQNA